ncbi:hypothetical protein ACHAXR_003946 [Thalassiosira sp. AJA248-18]
MNETTILLSPSPGDPNVKPDFLATVEPLIPRQPSFTFPFELVLDGYTREPWSSGKMDQNSSNNNSNEWQSCYLLSTDGRNRLAGFIQYLQGRKKAAVAKFEATDASSSVAPGSGKALLVVPFDPPPIPTEELPDGVDTSQVIFVKYLRDESILKKGSNRDMQKQQQQQKMLQQQKLMQEKQQQQLMQQKKAQQQQSQRKMPPAPAPASASASSSSKKGGLLGNLLGAQRRTENHLSLVRTKKSSNDADFDPNTGVAGCIKAFRTTITAKLQHFKSDPTTFSTKISIDLASLIKSIPSMEERDKLTMDAFKFTVYEQVEEVGEDQWIAAKEPSEFMDECTIAIYKDGHCPQDVLEDLNRGELPDEIKGQARHLVEAQSKAILRKGNKEAERMVKESIVGESNVTVLNTNKRDRRTLEQIQKDMHGVGEGIGGVGDGKRSRFE